MPKPIIGITCDTVEGHTAAKWKYEVPHEYADCVTRCGGVPLFVPYQPSLIPEYLTLCDGFLLSGGDDPDLTTYGGAAHPKARLMHAARQAFDSALIEALKPAKNPVLGVCLGMQMMALHHGGKLHPHLPELPDVGGEEKGALHKNQDHAINLCVESHRCLPREGHVRSAHHQAVTDAGTLRVVARSALPDRLIEAVDLPGERFYVGVQWHPERTSDPDLGLGVIQKLVEACKKS